jgi:two-component system, cell cycle sensor histidine kinase and response regulator CckA
MVLSDPESGRVIAASHAALALFGYTKDEMLALTASDLRDANGRACAKNGAILDIDLTPTNIVLDGVGYVFSLVYDIRPLAELEKRFRLMVESSTDGILLTDPLGRITYLSPGAERLLGVDHGELLGSAAMPRIHPEDARVIKRPSPGETVINLHRSIHKDGRFRWFEAYTTNLSHEVTVGAHVTNFRDVTERHEADEKLRRSEANFRTLIERLPTATLVHRAGSFVYVNPAAVAMLGWDRPSDLIGRSAIEFVHPDDQEAIRQAMAQTTTSGASGSIEVRMIRRDGRTVVVEGKSVLLDYDGEPTHVVLANDVTERRELFARMAVADRMLSVGTLAAGVAHEINNPLAYVAANLQILASELPKMLYGEGESRFSREELESVLNDAQEGAQRVSAIVRDLRALARSEDNANTPVDVLHVLASSIKMTHNEIRHRARIVQSYAEVPPVIANASRLGQVFLNLLVNAAHAIEDGHADANEVRIRVRADDTRVYVEIEDTGVGIPASVLPRIFDPFFTTKPAGVGVGLGLSICDRILEAFGGTISVTSKLGFGSTFRVALPIASKLSLAVAEEHPVPSQPRSRILMIDDEPAVGRSIRLLLAPDHEVINVTRALDGLARLDGGEHFDLILCDVMMPEMSGIELYEQLERRYPAYLQRIVFMTGGAFTSQARDALEQLGAPRLEKPFSEAALRRAIAIVSPPGDVVATASSAGIVSTR